MKYVILNPALAGEPAGSRIVDMLDGEDTAGMTVIEVADDFNWRAYKADFEALSVVPTLDPAKDAKWAEIKAIRDARQKVAPTDWGAFDSDTDDKTNIDGIISIFDECARSGIAAPDVINFTMHDDTVVPFDEPTFRRAALQVGLHIIQMHAIGQALRDAIYAAETIEQIEGVVWPA